LNLFIDCSLPMATLIIFDSSQILCVYNKDYPLCTNTLVISQLPMLMMSHNTMISQHNFHVFLGEWKDKISCSFELVASHCNLSCP
jgi:hypothetical protein